MTLTDAAENIGVSRDTLSDLERGNRRPVMPTLAKIAKGYSVPVEELFEEPVLEQEPHKPHNKITRLFSAAQFGDDDEVTRIVKEMDRPIRRELILACQFVLNTAEMIQRGSYRL